MKCVWMEVRCQRGLWEGAVHCQTYSKLIQNRTGQHTWLVVAPTVIALGALAGDWVHASAPRLLPSDMGCEGRTRV